MSRPELPHQDTSITLSPGSPPVQKTESNFVSPESAGEEKEENKSENPPKQNAEDTSGNTNRLTDSCSLAFMIIMLIWPWLFFGVIWKLHGVRLNNRVAKVSKDNPHGTTYFVTLIGSIISMIISFLFSVSIIRFAQEWVTKNDSEVEVFHMAVLSGIRHQTWPWDMDRKSIRRLLSRERWWPAALLLFCIVIFAFVTPSTTSLISPIPFNQTVPLTGTELDFSSSAADCLAWFDEHPRSNVCNWQSYNGLEYTSCLSENQKVDVLESGRGNIIESLSNNTQSLTFSQLGNKDGLHFLGSVRGVLPIGPNGVPAFDTLQNSPFSKPELRTAIMMVSYNYTLEHQGLSTNITCAYDTSSPIVYGPLVPGTTLALQYNSTCAGSAQVLTDVQILEAVNSNHTMLFWACQSPPNTSQATSYFIYLRGLAGYGSAIGNITCTVSPSPRSIFPVTYQSIPGIFSSKIPIATSASTRRFLIEQALVGLASLMRDAQNWESHDIAESVITLGVKAFALPPDKQDPKYLELYAAMLQGILDYEAAYIRLIYSTVGNPPSSCLRTVSGGLSYQAIGWSVQPQNIGYLVPMTLVNLASLAILIRAMHMVNFNVNVKGRAIRFDPTDPRQIHYCTNNISSDAIPDEWKDRVKFDEGKILWSQSESVWLTIWDFVQKAVMGKMK